MVRELIDDSFCIFALLEQRISLNIEFVCGLDVKFKVSLVSFLGGSADHNIAFFIRV